MMEQLVKARKGNKILRIKESAIERYATKGYSIETLDGKVISKSEAQTAVELKAENKELKKEIAKLKKALEKKNEKPVGEEKEPKEESKKEQSPVPVKQKNRNR